MAPQRAVLRQERVVEVAAASCTMPIRSMTACERVFTVVVKATISTIPAGPNPKSSEAAAASVA